jgi:hypothetical protein
VLGMSATSRADESSERRDNTVIGDLQSFRLGLAVFVERPQAACSNRRYFYS